MSPSPAATLAEAASRRWDAVVVGAGPAGAMAARELARRGRRVLLVDRREFPRDKVCGACLGGSALATLAAAGLEDALARCGGVPLSSFRLACRGRTAEIALPSGLALSRRRLDAALAGAAREAGATFLAGVRARWAGGGAGPSAVLTGAGGDSWTVRCRVAIAADGVGGSFLAGRPEARPVVGRGSRIGVGAAVAAPPAGYPRGAIQMAVGRAGYAGAVRLETGELNLAAALDRGAVRRAGGPGAAVAELLVEAGLPPVPGAADAEWRGTAELTRRAPSLARGGVFLVGDAASYVEPFTGEGMAWALAGARSLARLLADPLAAGEDVPWEQVERSWRRLHRREVGRRQGACRALAAALRHPALVAAGVRLLAARPRLAAPLVGRLNGAAVGGGREGAE